MKKRNTTNIPLGGLEKKMGRDEVLDYVGNILNEIKATE